MRPRTLSTASDWNRDIGLMCHSGADRPYPPSKHSHRLSLMSGPSLITGAYLIKTNAALHMIGSFKSARSASCYLSSESAS